MAKFIKDFVSDSYGVWRCVHPRALDCGFGWLARTVEKLDRIAPRPVLGAYLVITVLVLLVLIVHGGALATAGTGNAPEIAAASDFLHLSIAFALAALATAGLALIRPSSSPSELKFQTLWLTVTPFVVFVFLIVGALGG